MGTPPSRAPLFSSRGVGSALPGSRRPGRPPRGGGEAPGEFRGEFRKKEEVKDIIIIVVCLICFVPVQGSAYLLRVTEPTYYFNIGIIHRA